MSDGGAIYWRKHTPEISVRGGREERGRVRGHCEKQFLKGTAPGIQLSVLLILQTCPYYNSLIVTGVMPIC